MFTLISFAAVAYIIWKHDTIAGAMRSGHSPREHLEHEAKRKQELREYARELKLERKRMKEREWLRNNMPAPIVKQLSAEEKAEVLDTLKAMETATSPTSSQTFPTPPELSAGVSVSNPNSTGNCGSGAGTNSARDWR